MQNGELPRIYLLRSHATNLSLSASFSHFLALLSRSGSLSFSLSLSPSVFVSLFLLLSRSFCRTHFMFPPSLFVCFLFLSKSHSLFFSFFFWHLLSSSFFSFLFHSPNRLLILCASCAAREFCASASQHENERACDRERERYNES